MGEAEYCDRITIMNEGKIVALDTPSQLRKNHGVETIEELFVKITRPKNIRI
jgi:ABC-2 type transport system ATP-binding protein